MSHAPRLIRQSTTATRLKAPKSWQVPWDFPSDQYWSQSTCPCWWTYKPAGSASSKEEAWNRCCQLLTWRSSVTPGYLGWQSTSSRAFEPASPAPSFANLPEKVRSLREPQCSTQLPLSGDKLCSDQSHSDQCKLSSTGNAQNLLQSKAQEACSS